jgi:hypothetical protein
VGFEGFFCEISSVAGLADLEGRMSGILEISVLGKVMV